MSDVLNLFPARIPIGKWHDPVTGKDIPVNMSSEFERALATLFRRMGGPIALGNDDLALLTAGAEQSAANLAVARRIEDLEQELSTARAQLAQFATLARRIDDLERAAMPNGGQDVARLAQRLAYSEFLPVSAPGFVDWTRPGKIGSSTSNSGSFTSVSYSGQLTSTIATGTAPIVVSSTTKVINLNVDLLDGADWASPAAIGTTTPAAATFTTLTASGNSSLNGTSNSFGSTSAISVTNQKGSSSGVGGGASIAVQNGASSVIAIGNKSAIFGTAYDATPYLWYSGTLQIHGAAVMLGQLTLSSAAALVATNVALNNGAGAAAGTLTNASAAGNPTKWIPINDNGTIRYVPAW